MGYRASYYSADLNYDNQYYFLTKQIVGAVAGTGALIFAYYFDYHKLLKLKWWDKSIKEINELIPLLANSNIAYVKEKIKEMIDK